MQTLHEQGRGKKVLFPVITGSAAAIHCVKAHGQSQWRSPNYI